MPDLTNTNTIAQIDLLLKVLTFLVAIGLAIKAVIEYVRAQRWKRFEFIAQQLKEFNTDPQVRKVMVMLDWDERYVELFPDRETDKTVRVNTALLTTALHPDNDGPTGQGYTEAQARIRELFDAFFDKLSFFSIVMRSGLIHQEDLAPYLCYWLERLALPKHRGQAFTQNVLAYLVQYGYNDVNWLLEKFDLRSAV